MDNLLPILSLLVAALAVFFGPFIFQKIAERQIQSSLKIANKQIVGPMRQAWINNLRDLLADLVSSALHYYVSGFEDRSDEEYRRLTLLEHQVQLMLNPVEKDHQRLEELINQMTSALGCGLEGGRDFEDAYAEIKKLTRKILKREWDRVREDIPSN